MTFQPMISTKQFYWHKRMVFMLHIAIRLSNIGFYYTLISIKGLFTDRIMQICYLNLPESLIQKVKASVLSCITDFTTYSHKQ